MKQRKLTNRTTSNKRIYKASQHAIDQEDYDWFKVVSRKIRRNWKKHRKTQYKSQQ